MEEILDETVEEEFIKGYLTNFYPLVYSFLLREGVTIFAEVAPIF